MQIIAGIVQLTQPVRGITDIVLRVHMNVFSRANVLLSHNVALITVHVSQYQLT